MAERETANDLAVKVFPHYSRDAIERKYDLLVQKGEVVPMVPLEKDTATSTTDAGQRPQKASKSSFDAPNQSDISRGPKLDLSHSLKFSISASKALEQPSHRSRQDPVPDSSPVRPDTLTTLPSAQSTSNGHGRVPKISQPRGITADATGRLYSSVEGTEQRHHDLNKLTVFVHR